MEEGGEGLPGVNEDVSVSEVFYVSLQRAVSPDDMRMSAGLAKRHTEILQGTGHIIDASLTYRCLWDLMTLLIEICLSAQNNPTSP